MKKIRFLPFLLTAFLLFSQAAYAVFSDVSSDNKYYDAINYLQQNGIVEGYADGSFRPDQQVNRAEALKIILLGSKVLVPEIQKQDIFPDVAYGTWYAKYIAKAKNLGIINGDSKTGMFRPGDTINLAEILKMLLRTQGVQPTQPDASPYADVPKDSWFAPYFGYAFSIALLPQKSGENVRPSMPVTRGLMAQLIYQLSLKPKGYEEGYATYYAENFHGKGTASGEVFDASQFTAAHRTLPFGTWLLVKDLDNGKTVYVRVNDRGPYGDDTRIIDLSKAAFEVLAPASQGVAHVSITPVSGPPGASGVSSAPADCSLASPTTFAANTFENITLNTSLPHNFVSDEVFLVSGTSASSDGKVSAFLADSTGKQYSFTADKGAGGSFSIPVFFPGTGKFKFGVLPGESGSSIVVDISVLSSACLNESEDSSLPAPTELAMNVIKGDTVIQWQNDPSYDLNRLTFTQGSRKKEYFVHSASEFTPNYRDFEGWQEGDVQLQIRGLHLGDSPVFQAKSLQWSPPLAGSFKADTHHQYIVASDKVSVLSLPATLKAGGSLTLRVDPMVNLDEKGKVILPDGLVDTVELSSNSHEPMTGTLGIGIFPASAKDVSLTYTPKTDSPYFFEINDEQGIAAVNIPVYPESDFPLIPNPVDLSDLKAVSLGSDLSALQNQMLQLVNADRAAFSLNTLNLNSSLSQLAQSRADDMVKRNYFGHYNPDGMTANDLRKNYAITQYVSENIARDVSLPLAEYGLMRSASHRSNLLNAGWKRVGFGFASEGDQGNIFVQIFSADPISLSDVGSLRANLLGKMNGVRSSVFSLQDNLNTVAQAWSDKMAKEKFDDFTSPSGTSFFDTLRSAGVTATSGALIIGNSSFDGAEDQILANAELKEARWKNLGIGITQDSLGIIKIMLVYTE